MILDQAQILLDKQRLGNQGTSVVSKVYDRGGPGDLGEGVSRAVLFWDLTGRTDSSDAVTIVFQSSDAEGFGTIKDSIELVTYAGNTQTGSGKREVAPGEITGRYLRFRITKGNANGDNDHIVATTRIGTQGDNSVAYPSGRSF